MKIPIIAYVASTSYVLPVITGGMTFKKRSNATSVFLLCLSILVFEQIVEWILGRRGINNLFMVNWGSLVEVSLIMLMYIFAAEDRRQKNIYKLALGFFITSWIGIYLTMYKPDSINTPMIVISRLVIISVSIHYLYTLFNTTTADITEFPLFWFAAGNLIYNAGTVFVIGLGNELISLDYKYFLIAWHINWILIIVSNLLFAKGFLCLNKR